MTTTNTNALVAPNTQHMNEQDIAAKTKPTELFECFDPGTDKQHSQYDLFQDINILLRNNDDEELLQNVSVTDGMTNGAECVIEKIDDRVKDSTRPSITWVSFPEASIGQNPSQ